MSEISYKNLENFATSVRNEAEPHYSERTICPGYDYDESNPAFGQCGLTSTLAAKKFSFLALIAAFMEGNGEVTLGSGRKIHFPPMFLQMMRMDEKLRTQTENYADKVATCHYGNV